MDLAKLKLLSLDREVDLRGNPCSSEVHVLKALQEGRGQGGIIGERLWNHLAKDQPDQVSGLKCLWVSPAFSHCVFTASKSFDRTLGDRFTKLMLAMDPKDEQTADVMRLEGTSKWVAGKPGRVPRAAQGPGGGSDLLLFGSSPPSISGQQQGVQR